MEELITSLYVLDGCKPRAKVETTVNDRSDRTVSVIFTCRVQ